MSRVSIALAGLLVLAAVYLAGSSGKAETSGTGSQPGLRINDRYYEQYQKIRVQPTFGEWCKLFGKVYAS